MKKLKEILALSIFLQVIAKTQESDVPQYQILQFGQDATLKCTAADRESAQDAFWTKSGGTSTDSVKRDLLKDFPKDLRYSVSDENSLTIRNIKSKDVGSYSCNVLTKSGYKHNTIILNISQQSPKIRRKPRSKSARSGQDVEFRCLVSGYPEPSITWLHDELPISSEKLKHGSKRYKTKSYVSSTSLISASLTIKNVKKADQGEYTCLAQNEVGKDRGKLMNILWKILEIDKFQ